MLKIKYENYTSSVMKIGFSLLFLMVFGFADAQEVCNNGIDDDGNGQVDLNDAACSCNLATYPPSLIPNPSFEDYTCCPSGYSTMPDPPNDPGYNGLACANGWDQASDATSDFMNACNWTGFAPTPFPDGNGAAGFIIEIDIIGPIVDDYVEYLGNCLTSPMTAGVSYQLTFNIAFDWAGVGGTPSDPSCPVNITLFGTPNCSDIPWTGNDCPTNGGFMELGSVAYSPSASAGWSTVTISFIPSVNINAIALGGPCSIPTGCGYEVDAATGVILSPYFSVDNLILNQSSFFGITVEAELEDGTPAGQAGSSFCADDAVLIATSGDPGTFQWYLDGIALVGQTNQTLNVSQGGFGSGTYTVTLDDNTNCQSITYNVPICPIPPITLDVCLESNGDLTVNNGVAPFTWEEEAQVQDCSSCLLGCDIPSGCATTTTDWASFGTGQTVTPPSYPVRVTDSNGGELIVNNASQLPSCNTNCTPPTLSSTQQDVACAGGADGSIDLTVTGTSTYDFDWDNSATTEDINGLSAGDYTVIVVDQTDQNCTATETITILDGSGPSVTNISVTDAACGATDGEIDITATGATQYSIDGGTNFQASGTFTALAASTYTITIEDANGCQLDTVASISNANGPTIDNVVAVDPNCGATDGTITITATGADGYSIDNGVTLQATGVFTGLGAGTYDIVVGDLSGCLEFDQVVLNSSGGPTIDNVNTTDPSCGATDGEIDITATGGTPPLTYSIDNGVTTQANGIFTGLASATYDVVVDDASGCSSTQQAVLNNSGAPTIDNIAVTDATCGANDGQLVVTASGGNAPLTYSADGGTIFQPTGTFSGLAAGSYDIVVSDASGCQATQTASVSNSGAPVITSVNGLDVSCNGLCDGSLGIIATGATLYSIDGGTTFQPLPAFTDLCAGDYDIVVDDGVGCQSFDQLNITEPAAINANASTTDATCSGACDGTIGITANGGVSPLQYSVDNGTTFQPQSSFSAVCDGDYNVVVQDPNGCQTTLNATVSVPNPITFTFASTDVTCFGDCDGTATVNVQGGTAPYSYSWSGSTGNSATLPAICAGNYSLTVTDASGCSVDTTNFPIIEPPLVAIDNVVVVNEGCAGECDGSIEISAAGATEFSIDGGATFVQTPDFSDVCPSTYDLVVQNAAGCEGTGAATIIAGVPVVAAFNPLHNVVPELESTIQFANNSTGASIYSWHFGDGTYSSEENPTYDFANQPGTYLVCLTADNENGCIDTTCNYIDVTPLFTIYVPNAFTPNGSRDVNDVFIPVIRGEELYGSYTFIIFDRWGENIFQTNNMEIGWDGTFKDQPVQTGVYTWLILIEREEGGKNRRFVGHVTLL